MNTHKEAINIDDGWMYKPNNISSVAWPAQKNSKSSHRSKKMARIKRHGTHSKSHEHASRVTASECFPYSKNIPRLTNLHLV